MCPEWDDELIFFVASWDVYFPLADRHGVRFTFMLSIHEPYYIGTGLANILKCITWQLFVLFSNLFRAFGEYILSTIAVHLVSSLSYSPFTGLFLS